MIAYYTATKKVKFITVYSDEYRTKQVQQINVNGKIEAKKWCKENNVKPWNF